MRTVVDIYEEYRIPPWIQIHQLRVAAVGKSVCGAFDGPVAVDDVIQACLFHDMGNIMKTPFTRDNPLLPLIGEENLAYWQGVKDDFAVTYGTTEYDANDAIIRDIGVSKSVHALVSGMGFKKMPEILASGIVERHIVEYSDQRVGPYGVLSVDERFKEGQKRYKGRFGELNPGDIEQREKSVAAAHEMERLLFKRTRIRPEDITDASIAPIIEDLKKYAIS